MNNKKRYQKIFVNDEPIIDFTEQKVNTASVLSGNTFFDTQGNLQTGSFEDPIFELINGIANYDTSTFAYPNSVLNITTNTLFANNNTFGYGSRFSEGFADNIAEINIAANLDIKPYCLSLSSNDRSPVSLCVHTNTASNLDILALDSDNTGFGCTCINSYRNSYGGSTTGAFGLVTAIYTENDDYSLPIDIPYTLNRFATGCTFGTTSDGKYNYVKTSEDKILLTSINATKFSKNEEHQMPDYVGNCPIVHVGDFLFAAVRKHNIKITHLPEKLETIGFCAFVGVNFNNPVKLPDTVKQIHCDIPRSDSVFGQNKIKYELPDNFEGITVIATSSALYDGTGLFAPNSSVTEELMPEVYGYFVGSPAKKHKILYGISGMTNSTTNIVEIPEDCTQIINNTTGSDLTYLATKEIHLPSTLKIINGGLQSDWRYYEPWYSTNTVTEKIVFHSNCKILELGDGVLAGFENLTEINLPEGIDRLNIALLYGCKKLINLSIPESVRLIRPKALAIGTSSNPATIKLNSVIPPQLSTDAFGTTDASNINKILVPAGSRDAYISAANWANFAEKIEEVLV